MSLKRNEAAGMQPKLGAQDVPPSEEAVEENSYQTLTEDRRWMLLCLGFEDW